MADAEAQACRNLAESLGVPIRLSDDVGALARPVRVGRLLIPNSLAIHPMEGCDGDDAGRPSALTCRRYERFAAGGAGLIWAEAIAVVPEGRANPRQLWLHAGNKDSFSALVARMREKARAACGPDHRPVVVAQLTHSGRYSRPESRPHPRIPQHDPCRDARMKLSPDWPVLDDEYLDRLQDVYVTAARLAFEVGFDAVDIKSCHGYLINELLSCRQRPGRYGGTFENRTRLLLEVIDRIRGELGREKPIAVRLGVFDALPFPYGWGVDETDPTKPDLTEPKRLIGQLVERGVGMVNITIGSPYYNPHYGRPFNAPVAGQYLSPEHPMSGVARLISLTGEIQKSFPGLAIVGTGYSWLGAAMPYAAAAAKDGGAATIVGVGRMAFAYPDFAKDILKSGRLDPKKVCIACSGCTQIMRDGGMAGCVVRDAEIYGPIFRQGRLNNRGNLARLAQRCMQCALPSCRSGCPARVDIPRFIKLFIDGKDREAYEVIRESNIMPEICAWLCPVEEQCEGHCLSRHIGDGPAPIAAVQRYLAEEASREGWTRLQTPQETSGKHVAVLGAGPAGLACAAVLLRAGHAVTVFDKSAEPGGMIESAVPAERQGCALRNEIGAIFQDVPKDRLAFQFGMTLAPAFNLDRLMAQGFDAVFIGLGLPRSASSMGKRNVSGVIGALEFLRQARTGATGSLTGKRVAVIGGGNTALDAAVTAIRLGAKDVRVIYRRSFAEMPAWPAERDRATRAGVHFLILTHPLDYVSVNGQVVAIKLCPTTLDKPDASGRRAPEPQKDSPYELKVDRVIEALGQDAPADLQSLLPGVELEVGRIKLKRDSTSTSRAGVFAGGDLAHGASTVVAAVADGMNAGREINEFLNRKGS